MERGSHPRRSSGLRFQFLDAEVLSFLPQRQRKGGNLARQRQPHPGWLDAFGQRALVKILERSGQHAGPDRGGFEQAFQIMVVILIQTPNPHLFLAPPHLAFYEVVFPAVASFQPQHRYLTHG